MKQCMQAKKNTIKLIMALIGVLFLLGLSGVAQAETVQFENTAQPTAATGILNLEVGGTFYNVTFNEIMTAEGVYGPYPGTYTFTSAPTAAAAATAVNDALSRAGAEWVGAAGDGGFSPFHFIGYAGDMIDPPGIGGPTEHVLTVESAWSAFWFIQGLPAVLYADDERSFATFTVVGADCGNGVLEGNEECDDGNNEDDDGCSATCTIEEAFFCGDGTLDPFEECDDGNNDGGDGCSAVCINEECGNGILDPGEECDDGNLVPYDGCSVECITEFCGDGITNNVDEQCDDGNTVSGDGCSENCVIEGFCGNGILDGVEECDDGNTVNGDGCSSDCEIETVPEPDPGVLRDCQGGTIVGGKYSAIILTDYEDCVIMGVAVSGRGVIVKNPRGFAILNSYVEGKVRVIRNDKSLEESTAIVINNVIRGGNLVIRELLEADVRGNSVYDGNIRVIDDESQPNQIADVLDNRIKRGNLRVNNNLAADVKGNSSVDGNIICRRNLDLVSRGNEADQGLVRCPN